MKETGFSGSTPYPVLFVYHRFKSLSYCHLSLVDEGVGEGNDILRPLNQSG